MVAERSVSKFYGDKEIIIIKPEEPKPVAPIKYTIRESVGGFLGIKTTQFSAVITFEKKAYFLGEKAKIEFQIDNSQCKKALKFIKFKVYNRI